MFTILCIAVAVVLITTGGALIYRKNATTIEADAAKAKDALNKLHAAGAALKA